MQNHVPFHPDQTELDEKVRKYHILDNIQKSYGTIMDSSAITKKDLEFDFTNPWTLIIVLFKVR